MYALRSCFVSAVCFSDLFAFPTNTENSYFFLCLFIVLYLWVAIALEGLKRFHIFSCISEVISFQVFSFIACRKVMECLATARLFVVCIHE